MNVMVQDLGKENGNDYKNWRYSAMLLGYEEDKVPKLTKWNLDKLLFPLGRCDEIQISGPSYEEISGLFGRAWVVGAYGRPRLPGA